MYVEKLINYEKIKTFSRNEFEERFNIYKKFLNYLGNPQDKLKTVIITGSSGKGTTAYVLSAVLKNSGYSVGTYTSPHLTDERERISVDFKLIPLNKLKILRKNILKKYKKFKLIEDIKINLSYFELMTITAFFYFIEKKVNYAVMEVGLGGRFDAVNVGTPEISVITSICKDHTRFLGNTLKSILSEKAYIIRPHKPVITGITQKKLLLHLKNYAEHIKSHLFISGEDFKIKFVSISDNSLVFRYNDYLFKSPLYSIDSLNSIGLAFFTAEKILNGVETNILTKTIENINLKGRFQLIKKEEKRVIIDAGHNLCAAASFVKTVKKLHLSDGLLIFTIMQDKEADSILKKMSQLTGRIVLFRLNMEREYDLNLLIQISSRYFKEVKVIKSLKQLLKYIKQENISYIFGSFYLAGKILEKIDLKNLTLKK